MNKTCRFKECGVYGYISVAVVKIVGEKTFPLIWCSKCGRIQTKLG